MEQATLETGTNAPLRGGQGSEHFDVLIVGAGISGIGEAYHLQQQCPDRTFVILEGEDSFGGTWHTHRYPGIRSDSDLYTFGYRFKPWVGPPIATAAEILSYMGEVIEENGIARHIRYGHRVKSAAWSSETNLWTIKAVRTDTGEAVSLTANFLWMCQGYYRHNEGYTPDWPGMDRFKGRIVHPENWPDDVDYTGKKVVLIGSGATAATIAPAIAADCAELTLLQRTPTYFVPGRNAIEIADQLRQLQVDETWIHEIVRRQINFNQAEVVRRCIEEPDAVRQELLDAVGLFLPPEEVAKNFTPTYRPWRQRIAFVPDGDLFVAMQSGHAKVVTGEIETFTETGLKLKSGQDLEADLVITATGFNLSALGDIEFEIDGKTLSYADTLTYRGMMFTGIPNMALVFGYFRASWTLRTDLVGDFVCRLLNHMKAIGAARVEVKPRPQDEGMAISTWIDPENFNPGYLMRGMHLLPKRGEGPEWQHTQDYWMEKDLFPTIDLSGPEFVYTAQKPATLAAE